MRRFPIHVALMFTLFVAIAPLASGTTYNGPLLFTPPSHNQNTEVVCTTCSATDMGKKSVGYQGAISSFVGRYNDSAFDSEGFQLPRPLRVRQMKYDAVHDRLYMRVGSFLIGYDVARLISRLQANERLITINRSGDVSPAGTYLPWDKSFNIENSWPQSGLDGGDWLPDFDFDDRGNLFPTEGVVWGSIVDDYKNDGNFLDDGSKFAPPDGSARAIIVVKASNGHYYIGVSPERGSTTIFDVTDRKAPLPGPTLTHPFAITDAAKTADNHWVGIVNSTTGAVEIFTTDNFVANRAPTFTTGTRVFRAITSDGTNFYSTQVVNGKISISKFIPSGATISEESTPTTHGFRVDHLNYGSGYLTISGTTSTDFTMDILVYRVGNGSMTELDLLASGSNLKTNRYVTSYYDQAAVPSGYLASGYNSVIDSIVIAKNGHTYLFVNAKGLGDVYEIKGSDSITAQNKGITGTPNPNSAQTGSGPYYGDKIVFGSTTSAPTPINVNWNFANPESSNNVSAATTGVDVTHQFSGLTATSQFASPRIVTVTSTADSSIFDSQSVTLAVPAARAGIVGQPILFTIPNASSAAPIVTSDQWKDASDGTIEGHFASWNIDGNTTRALPNATVPVGACGAHSLIFTANYGPYSGAGSTLASTNGTLAQAINSINYQSLPFAAVVSGPTSDATNVTFTSGSRGSTDTSVLPAAASFSYQWDLLNSSGTSLQTTSGNVALGQVPPFVVPRTNFSGLTGARVRLQLSTTATLGANCSSASSATTGPLSAPDPVVTILSGCQYTGATCNLSVTSASGADTSGWNVTWSFNPTGPAGGNSLTFSPAFTTTYTGSVIASVTNAIGTGSASKPLSIATPPCNIIPTAGDFVVSWFGTSAGCQSPNGTCQDGETIKFSVTTGTYAWNATCDSYLWTFGDGATASGKVVTHKYPNGVATYSGKFELTVGTAVLTFPFTVKTGAVTGCGNSCGCGNNCPTCPQITADSAFASYTGNTSGCTYVNTSIGCQTGESVAFSAVSNFYSGYNFNCGTHSFNWNFGDGQSGSGQNVSHTYAAPGNYSATVLVNSPTGAMVYSVSVPVGGGGVCTAPTSSNVGLTLAGSASGCSATAPNCKASELISFGLSAGSGYSFSACEHTITWDFGDGGNGTGQSVTHSYSGSQAQYTVHVTVANQSGSTTLTKVVNIAAGSCPVPTTDLIFLTYAGSGGCSVFTPTASCVTNDAITFTANANTLNRYNFNCGTHTFAWDFDDGATATQQNPSHVFALARTYNVKCTITNTSGAVTLTLPITITHAGSVDPGVQVGFSYVPVGNNPLLIQFTPSVVPANSVTTWRWNFGDNTPEISYGGTSTSPQFHSYTAPGTYVVTLTTNAGVVTKQVMVGTTPRSRPSRH